MFGKQKNLGKQLKSQAESLGACEEGLFNIERLNEQELINRYVHYVNFACKKDFPSNEFIKRNFDKQLLEHNNIYVDSRFERRNARQVVIIQGDSEGVLLFDGFTASDVYIRHNSEVVIDCSRMSKVFVNVYNNAKVRIIQREGASVYVYKHSDFCEVSTEGDVMIRNIH